MKPVGKILFASTVLISSVLSNQAVASDIRIETGDAIYGSLSHSQAQAAAKIVQIKGYSCDSISKFKPLIMSDGFNLICNNWHYEYDIKNIGGNFVVEPQ